MAIVTLPLPIQLINGNVADGGQVMTDLNAIASNVNANAAKNGVNSDITALTALISINSGITVTGWTISTSSIVSSTIDNLTTGVTQPFGTSNTTLATTAFVQAVAFSSALPNQTGNADKYVTTNGTTASWSDILKVGTIKLADSTDTTKRAQFNLTAITTGTTRTITMPDRDVVLGNGLVYSSRTSNTILGIADTGTFIDVQSGTFTQTFTAAATLGNTWFCYYRNNGTGDITLDPNGGELIDGLTSYIMYPGEARLIVCTGTAFFTIVLSPFSRTFTATGNFTKPPGYNYFAGLLWGGGGSGAATGLSTNDCTGGGGGSCLPFVIPASVLGATTSITIGAGGTAVTSNSGAAAALGNAGGTSTFGSFGSAFGGGGGFGAATGTAYSAGSGGGILAVGAQGSSGNAIGGSPNSGTTTTITDNPGYGGSNSFPAVAGGNSVYGGAAGGSLDSANTARAAGNSVYGGGGGGSAGLATQSNGGTSTYGGAGGNGSNGTTGGSGTAPAGGGGAAGANSNATRTSGAGARGECRVWGVA